MENPHKKLSNKKVEKDRSSDNDRKRYRLTKDAITVREGNELTESRRRFLNDPRATVLAATIGGIGLVVGAVIALAGNYLISRENPKNEIAGKRAEQKIKDKSRQDEQVINAFDEALKAIQGMKDTISEVINKPHIKNREASALLEVSSKNLTYAYGGNPETGTRAFYIEICGAVSQDCPFHRAKNLGQHALTWVQAQPDAEELSNEVRTRLGQFRTDFDRLQQEISKSRSEFIEGMPN